MEELHLWMGRTFDRIFRKPIQLVIEKQIVHWAMRNEWTFWKVRLLHKRKKKVLLA